MLKCDQCGCMTWDRVTLPDGRRVCEYCEVAYDAEKKLAKAAKVHRTRHYNNLIWLIKQDHKTVRNWCKKHGLSYAVAEAVLHKKGHYATPCVDEMSAGHLDVLIAAQKDGYEKVLLYEGYVEV